MFWELFTLGAICNFIEKGWQSRIKAQDAEESRRNRIETERVSYLIDGELEKKLRKDIIDAYSEKVTKMVTLKWGEKETGIPSEELSKQMEEGISKVKYRASDGSAPMYTLRGSDEPYNMMWQRIERHKRDGGQPQYNDDLWDKVCTHRITNVKKEENPLAIDEDKVEQILSLLINTYGKYSRKDAKRKFGLATVIGAEMIQRQKNSIIHWEAIK